jgi:hypothetical protein
LLDQQGAAAGLFDVIAMGGDGEDVNEGVRIQRGLRGHGGAS